MNRKCFLFFITVVVIIGGFILSGDIVNATDIFRFTAAAICNKGTTADRAPCGTTCIDSCNNLNQVVGSNGETITVTLSASQREICREKARAAPSWTQYSINGRITVIYSSRTGRTIVVFFDFVNMASVCSIADKCYGNTCANPRSPYLRAGRCECGEVGGRYKICCRREGNRYVEVAAIRATGEDDGHPPEEGMCPGGWVAPPNVTQCPAPPTPVVPVPSPEFRIDSFLANPTTITPGQFTTLTWATTGATDCRITRTGGAGLGNVPPDGSGQSNPPTTTTYTLNCGREGNITERRSASATVTVAPAAQRWWFCANNACRQTTGQFTTAADCQAAVLQHWRINTTCHRTEDECRPGCGVSPVPTPITPAPTPVISTHNDVHINNFSVSPTCIPQQPTNRREATLSWNVSIGNSCPTEPNDAHTFVPGSNDSNCGGGQGSWTSGWTLTSPSSYTASCIAFGGWSGDKNLRGTESIPPPSFTTTYGLSCSRTDTYTCRYSRSYSFRNWECIRRRWVTRTCTRIENGVTISFDCSFSECAERGCVSRTGSVSGSGPTFGPSSSSRETTLAVVQPLNNVTLESEKDRILHKTSTDISWSSSAPSSGVSTNIRCTPSVQANGDGTNWTGAINSLDSSGTRRISPRRTTTYELLCRNIYQNDQACYTYRSATQLIRVFDPDLREVPAFYDGFMRLVGRIGNALR